MEPPSSQPYVYGDESDAATWVRPLLERVARVARPERKIRDYAVKW